MHRAEDNINVEGVLMPRIYCAPTRGRDDDATFPIKLRCAKHPFKRCLNGENCLAVHFVSIRVDGMQQFAGDYEVCASLTTAVTRDREVQECPRGSSCKQKATGCPGLHPLSERRDPQTLKEAQHHFWLQTSAERYVEATADDADDSQDDEYDSADDWDEEEEEDEEGEFAPNTIINVEGMLVPYYYLEPTIGSEDPEAFPVKRICPKVVCEACVCTDVHLVYITVDGQPRCVADFEPSPAVRKCVFEGKSGRSCRNAASGLCPQTADACRFLHPNSSRRTRKGREAAVYYAVKLQQEHGDHVQRSLEDEDDTIIVDGVPLPRYFCVRGGQRECDETWPLKKQCKESGCDPADIVYCDGVHFATLLIDGKPTCATSFQPSPALKQALLSETKRGTLCRQALNGAGGCSMGAEKCRFLHPVEQPIVWKTKRRKTAPTVAAPTVTAALASTGDKNPPHEAPLTPAAMFDDSKEADVIMIDAANAPQAASVSPGNQEPPHQVSSTPAPSQATPTPLAASASVPAATTASKGKTGDAAAAQGASTAPVATMNHPKPPCDATATSAVATVGRAAKTFASPFKPTTLVPAVNAANPGRAFVSAFRATESIAQPTMVPQASAVLAPVSVFNTPAPAPDVWTLPVHAAPQAIKPVPPSPSAPTSLGAAVLAPVSVFGPLTAVVERPTPVVEAVAQAPSSSLPVVIITARSPPPPAQAPPPQPSCGECEGLRHELAEAQQVIAEKEYEADVLHSRTATLDSNLRAARWSNKDLAAQVEAHAAALAEAERREQAAAAALRIEEEKRVATEAQTAATRSANKDLLAQIKAQAAELKRLAAALAEAEKCEHAAVAALRKEEANRAAAQAGADAAQAKNATQAKRIAELEASLLNATMRQEDTQAASSAASAAALQHHDPAELCERSESFYAAKWHVDALAVAATCIEHSPEYKRAYIAYGRAAIALGEFHAAAVVLQAGLKRFVGGGEQTETIRSLHEIATTAPGIVAKALHQWKTNNESEAQRATDSLLKHDCCNRCWEIHFPHALSSIAMFDLDDRSTYVQQVIACFGPVKRRRCADFHFLVGYDAAWQGKMKEALDSDFAEALQIDPQHELTLSYVKKCKEALSREESAEKAAAASNWKQVVHFYTSAAAVFKRNFNYAAQLRLKETPARAKLGQWNEVLDILQNQNLCHCHRGELAMLRVLAALHLKAYPDRRVTILAEALEVAKKNPSLIEQYRAAAKLANVEPAL